MVQQYEDDVHHPKIEEHNTISLHEKISCFLLLKNTNVLVIGNEKGFLRFYDIEEKKFVLSFQPHEDSIRYLSGDALELLSLSKDRLLSYWKVLLSGCESPKKNDGSNKIQDVADDQGKKRNEEIKAI